jgi:Skp family chaperone for outer membrane proteins
MTVRLLSLAVILVLGATLPASLASAQELKLAVVDMDAISQQYKELADQQTELQNWVKERRAFLNAMQDFMFVSGEEFQELGRLYQVPNAQWNDEQKKREGEVRKIAEDSEKRFLDLQAKPARTAEEQNAYNVLRDTYQARERDLTAITRAFDDELRVRRGEVQDKLSGNVRTVIEQVGKAQGLNAVFDRAVVFYFSAELKDITEDVLKALNAGGAAPAPAAGGGGGAAPAPAPAP